VKNQPSIIEGGFHSDHRGSINFFNTFDMTQIKRFYVIENSDTEIKRGWRGHRIEQRWFFVSKGAFLIQIVKIDDWEEPNPNSPVFECELSNEKGWILHVPFGYATCIRSLEDEARICVFADYGIENAELDNYLYPEDYFRASVTSLLETGNSGIMNKMNNLI